MLCGSNIRISTQITETLPSAKVKWILFCYVLQMSWSCITLLQFIFFLIHIWILSFLGAFPTISLGLSCFFLVGESYAFIPSGLLIPSIISFVVFVFEATELWFGFTAHQASWGADILGFPLLVSGLFLSFLAGLKFYPYFFPGVHP